MNISVKYNPIVSNSLLDQLSNELPRIISETMDTGYVVRVRPEQISLAFSPSTTRDTGADIKIIVFAQKNEPRISTKDERAKMILDKVIALNAEFGGNCSIDVRLYLMEIGAAECS